MNPFSQLDFEQSKLPAETKAAKIAEFESRIASCDLCKDMQELTSYYICLEEFFMVESVKKVSLTSAGPKTLVLTLI